MIGNGSSFPPVVAVMLLVTSVCHGQQTSNQWPSSYKPNRQAKIIVHQKGDDSKPYIYRTRNFHLHSTSALPPRELKAFATIMESVPEAIGKLPLPLFKLPQNQTAKVHIYANEEEFAKAGGAAGAGGYYDGRKQAILLRADAFLTPPNRAGSRLKSPPNYDLLVHEFTHLCMHQDLAYLPVWFTEGTAEYMAAAHTANGQYQFSKITELIRRHIRNNLPNDKDVILLPSVVSTMAHSHKSWRESIETGKPENHYRAYATSLLITHTLFHGGEKRRAETRQLINHIHNNRGRHANYQAATEKLIPAATRAQLQNRIQKYWKSRGLNLKFIHG